MSREQPPATPPEIRPRQRALVKKAGSAVAVKPRRNQRLPREVRERQIQQAALSVFREYGFERGPVSEIARRAGLAEGALYTFYRSKKEIFEAVICQWYEVTLNEYKAQYATYADPYQRLKFAVRHNLDCLCDDIAIANLYLELRRDNSFRSSRLIAYNKEYIGMMKRTIRELQALSEKDQMKTSLVAETIYSLIEAKTELYRFGERSINKDEVATQVYEVALRLI